MDNLNNPKNFNNKKPYLGKKSTSDNADSLVNNKSYNELYNYYCVDNDNENKMAYSRSNSKSKFDDKSSFLKLSYVGETQKKVLRNGRNIELQLFSINDSKDDKNFESDENKDSLIDDFDDKSQQSNDDLSFTMPRTKLQKEKNEKHSEKTIKKFDNLLSSKTETDLLSLSTFKRSLFMIWRKRFSIIAIMMVAYLISTLYFFTTSTNSYTVILSLNYEQSSKGLYPNSIRFNMTEIKSNEVMEQAIEYAGLKNVVSPSELANNVSVLPLATSSVNKDKNYIATSYNITYNENKKIKNISTRDMCVLICKAYSDVFHKNYTDNYSVLDYKVDGTSSEEFLVLAEKYETKANMLSRYLEMRANSAKAYTDEITGETFKSLRKRVSNLVDYDIANFKSYVLESGISKNKPHYNSVLLYKNRMMDIDYKKKMASYNSNRAGISMYDAAMSAVVMIPTEFENSGKKDYYMSRTNSEYDFMADNAKWNLKDATDVKGNIAINKDIISKLNVAKPSAGELKKANDLILSIEDTLDKLTSDIAKTDKSYIHKKTNDYLTFKQSSASIKTRLGVKNSLLISAGVFALSCVNIYFSQRKKEKYD